MNNDDQIIEEEGVESEEDLGKQNPATYSKAVIWGTDWTSETIVNQLRRKNIDLNPEFQRRDAWDVSKKSKFIESIILGLPVPPIILAERKNKKNSYLVIDGKQRLLSIMQFCATEEDTDYDRLSLSNLDILKEINGNNYETIKSKIFKTDYITQFDNQTIRAVVIRNWPNENFLYTVFLRLNTGSLKLSPQELRQALHPGPFLTYISSYSEKENPVRDMLKLKKADSRMRDVELIIRYFAFKNFLSKYKDSLKDFLDDACNEINKDWGQNNTKYSAQLSQLEEAIKFTTKIFGVKSRFSKYINHEYTNSFNRTIYDIMVFSFSNENIRKKLVGKDKDIKKAFEEIMTTDKDFIVAVSGSTKDLEKTKKRYALWNKKIESIK
jgi:hypothetical protein